MLSCKTQYSGVVAKKIRPLNIDYIFITLGSLPHSCYIGLSHNASGEFVTCIFIMLLKVTSHWVVSSIAVTLGRHTTILGSCVMTQIMLVKETSHWVNSIFLFQHL